MASASYPCDMSLTSVWMEATMVLRSQRTLEMFLYIVIPLTSGVVGWGKTSIKVSTYYIMVG